MNVQRGCAYCRSAGRHEDLPSGLYCRGETTAPEGDIITAVEDETGEEQQKALLCLVCSAPITTAAQRIEKQGKHLHTFFNPAGIVYEIGCFREAPGCLIFGSASSHFAWFSGHSWRIVYCSECLEHLGWTFFVADERFFGLIVNRLREG